MRANPQQTEEEDTETSPLLYRIRSSSLDPTSAIPPIGPEWAKKSADHGTFTPSKTSDCDSDVDTDVESQPQAGEDRAADDAVPDVRKRLPYIFAACAIGVFMSAADQTIIVSSYGKIGSDLNALNKTSWIATAYFLTLTSFQPLYGKLSDIFGRKACMLSGYFIFGVGCLCCGLATNIEQLIVARAFAGIGGGGMTTVFSILMSDIIPLRDRGTWQGYINIVYATGSSTGAPLGGLLADSIGWRWAFLAQAPLCLLAFISVYVTLHLPTKDDSKWKEKFARIDFLGAVVLIAAVLTLLIGLDRGSNVSWSAKITIACLCSSLPLFVIFVLVEMKWATEPFAPGNLIFSRGLVACYACNFFSIGGWLATQFYVPLYFQAVNGDSATTAGLKLIPSIIGGVSGSLFGGYMMRWTGRFYWLTVIGYFGSVLALVGVFLFSGVITNNIPIMIVCLAFGGFNAGITITTTLIGLIANASKDDQAIVTACSYLFRSLGAVFGVSMSATVANQSLRSSLAAELPRLGLSEERALEIAARVRESLTYLRKLSPEVQAVVADCYGKSTSAAFGLQIGIIAGAAVCAWFIREKTLSR